MKVDQVLNVLKAALGEGLAHTEVRVRRVGAKAPVELKEIWAEIDRDAIVPAVAALKALGPLHMSVISGQDAGERIELLYHIAVGYGTEGGEVMVTLRLAVPKDDARVPSICHLIPGAETTEREKIEFLGVEFVGIPDSRHVFLPDDLPVHPWRKDEPEMGRFLRRMVEWEGKDG